MSAQPEPAPRAVSGREVAVTFDDLPVISVTRGDVASHRAITRRLLAGVTARSVPTVGFVNELNLIADGVADPARVELLREWITAGFELGNHTFGHLDLHATPVERFEDDVVRGEPVIRGLLGSRGMPLRYFRHPYLRTGTSLATRRRVEAFLAGRGYTIAPVTVYTEDYLFAAAYDRAELRGDRKTAQRVADAYVPYVDACEPSRSHPAVTHPLRPNGFPDYNYECFVPVYSAMFSASLDAVRARPLDYVVSRVDALKFSADHLEEAGYGHGLLRVVRPIYRVAFLDVRSDVDTAQRAGPPADSYNGRGVNVGRVSFG